MTSNPTLSKLALAMMALPALLGALLCLVRPQGAWLWIIAMLAAPAAWLVVKTASKIFGNITLGGMLRGPDHQADTRKALSSAMIFTCWIIALPMGAKLAEAFGLIDHSLANAVATRWTNILFGGYLVLKGNHLPKILTPWSDLRCDPSTMQTLQRRTSLIFVLAGLAYVFLWLVLPTPLAEPIGLAVIAAGILAPSVVIRSYAKGRVGTPSR